MFQSERIVKCLSPFQGETDDKADNKASMYPTSTTGGKLGCLAFIIYTSYLLPDIIIKMLHSFDSEKGLRAETSNKLLETTGCQIHSVVQQLSILIAKVICFYLFTKYLTVFYIPINMKVDKYAYFIGN